MPATSPSASMTGLPAPTLDPHPSTVANSAATRAAVPVAVVTETAAFRQSPSAGGRLYDAVPMKFELELLDQLQ